MPPVPAPDPNPPGQFLDGTTSNKLHAHIGLTGDSDTWSLQTGDAGDRGGRWDYMIRILPPRNPAERNHT